MTTMRIIYVAGPYRSDTIFGTKQNILRAEKTGVEVARLNHIPLIPHTLYQFWDGLQDEQWFVDATMQLILKCDVVLVIPDSGWQSSSGTKGEIKAAEEAGIPVFYSLLDLRSWLAAEKRKPKDTKSWYKKVWLKSTKG